MALQLPAVRRHLSVISSQDQLPDVCFKQRDFCLEALGDNFVGDRASSRSPAAKKLEATSLRQAIVDIIAGKDLEQITLGDLRDELERRLKLDSGALDEFSDSIAVIVTQEISQTLSKSAHHSSSQDGSCDSMFEARLQEVQKGASLACDAKLFSAIHFVKRIFARLETCTSEKVVLFAHHRRMLDTLQTLTRLSGLQFIRMDGQVSRRTRQELMSSFQQESDVRVALCSITACGEGLDLTIASTLVFCELHWTPSVLEQCEARVHRHGQTKAVEIWYLLAEGSLDEWMWRTLQSKRPESDSI